MREIRKLDEEKGKQDGEREKEKEKKKRCGIIYTHAKLSILPKGACAQKKKDGVFILFFFSLETLKKKAHSGFLF